MDTMTAGVSWFPQEYAPMFYVLKGVLSLIATALLLAHMRTVKAQEGPSSGRWLRYLVLLYFAVLLTGASVEQVGEDAAVNYRNLGGLLGSVALIATVLVSIAESREKR